MNALAKDLLAWFEISGRKNLPWQSNPSNIYYIWVSEVMLQQTQVATVTNYFSAFIVRFPTLSDLAHADIDEVLALWAGLGYYSRARNLHKSARIILTKFNGDFPLVFTDVLSLPGVGESTAGAILSLGAKQRHPILDGNVKRVLCRYRQIEGHYSNASVLKTLWQEADFHTPSKANAEYTQAIMDLGATVCTRSRPKCNTCPISKHCQANLCQTQNQYPNKKPSSLKPTKSTAMLIFQNEKGGVYLNKRPDKGIWGGLWSLIECDDSDPVIIKTVKSHNALAKVEKTLPQFKHSFSHYHLLIRPILISSPGLKRGYENPDKHSKGVPAPVKKILSQL
ncbi:MAG: A/G-specific adenine glycosylase [Gammaproteobacteria bacterium]